MATGIKASVGYICHHFCTKSLYSSERTRIEFVCLIACVQLQLYKLTQRKSANLFFWKFLDKKHTFLWLACYARFKTKTNPCKNQVLSVYKNTVLSRGDQPKQKQKISISRLRQINHLHHHHNHNHHLPPLCQR